MGENRNTVLATAFLLLVAVAAGAGLGIMRRPPVVIPDSSPPPSAATSPERLLDVHVAGWVANPGVVSVDDGAIVADAIAAAGGMRPGANAEGVNLAAPLVAGQQVVVPGPNSAEVADKGNRGNDLGGPISLNRATETELESLPGVGPVLAQRIVSHRESHGPFDQVEDLLQVPGIGEAKLASLRDLVQP